MLGEIGALHDAKNFDYADGAKQGPLGNFDRVAAFMSAYPPSGTWCSPAGVALTYLLKQLDAACILMTTGKDSQTGEGVRERLRDVACYAIIMLELLDREHGNA